MKLYLVTRTDDWSYDDYDSFLVAAENEASALSYHPNGQKLEDYLSKEDIMYGYYGGWTFKENLTIECIGESYSKEEKVIIRSFNAG